MRKFLYAVCAFLLAGSSVSVAMPARRSVVEGTMSDGTAVRAVLHGDEFFHYYVSEDDGSLLLRRGESFVKADLDAAGRLVETDKTVPARLRAAALDAAATARRRIPGLVEGTTFPPMGSHKVAVVLVDYQDVKFELADPHDYFSRMLNEEGFSDYWATGSARDWFIASSGGQFVPVFDVFGPVTLQKNREYYGGNNEFGQDNNPQKMVIEACRQLNPTVDFSEYDRDGDGVIDNVFVVYAGRGEATGGSSDCVWPHAWTLNGAEPGQAYTFDGVRLNRYACSNEWELSEVGHGYRPVGIGTFVHEFSHVMGLPDLYSTKYVQGNFTPGAWSAMDYGPYNNDGCTPPLYSAWERASLGYIKLRELGAEQRNVALRPLDKREAYMISTGDEYEYFVLENRQQTGWDAFIPGHGMLVWHIDYDADVWSSNEVNNNIEHNRVDLLEADGILTNETRAGDAFPGTEGISELSDATDPALKTWAGKSTGIALTDIREIDDRIAFRVNGGSSDIAAPEMLPAKNITPASFIGCWKLVPGAVGYWVTLTTVGDEPRTIVDEYVADAEAYFFNALVPATDYRYSVRADDGFFGSAQGEWQNVTTADPTFDYFSPVALPASDIKPESVRASWEPLEGAKSYKLELLQSSPSEIWLDYEGFDNGVENLMENWSSTSKSTYGMVAYCGSKAPSLRMAADNDVLQFAVESYFICGVHFWHRGNGTGDDASLMVEVSADGSEWEFIEEMPVVTEKGGADVSVVIPSYQWRYGRIRFSRGSKGSVAIDDVSVDSNFRLWSSTRIINVPAEETSAIIDDLEPNRLYRYRVTASDGKLQSKPSNSVEFRTPQSSAIEAPLADKVPFRLDGDAIVTDIEVSVYDIAGRCVAQGSGRIALPAAGVYIVDAEGFAPVKLAL